MSAIALNGAIVGCIYGLIAAGLVVVYRGSRVINFAYGQAGMVGAFFFTDIRFGVGTVGLAHDHGLLLALPAGVAIAAALGGLTELAVIRPLRNAPRIRPLVGTFAVGALFFVFASRRWGLSPRYTAPLVDGDGVTVAGLQVQPEQLLIVAVSAVVLASLWLLYRFTPLGLRLRAIATDPYAAGLVGVDVNRTSLATWVLAGAVSGLSAILIAPLVSFNVGFMTTLSIRALAAALVGGLTNVGGAFAAGVLIGVVEAVIAYQTPVQGITDVLLAGMILLLMIVRPTGLVRSAY